MSLTESQRIEMLEDYVEAMDGFILRVGLALTENLPAAEPRIAAIFSEWNSIKRQIQKDHVLTDRINSK